MVSYLYFNIILAHFNPQFSDANLVELIIYQLEIRNRIPERPLRIKLSNRHYLKMMRGIYEVNTVWHFNIISSGNFLINSHRGTEDSIESTDTDTFCLRCPYQNKNEE